MAFDKATDWKRIVDLGAGQAIYDVNIEAFREQNKNARIMDPDMFQRLTENIRRDNALRSLPFCVLTTNRAGNQELEIVSGHHRVRAARAAGLERCFALVDERELSRDEIISEQLAQNAIQGKDDPQILAELYAEIEDIEKKIETGIREEDLMFDLPPIDPDSTPQVDLDVEIVNIMFLRYQYDHWQEAMELLHKDADVYIADQAQWDEFASIIRTVSVRENVRAVGAILSRMVDIVLEHYARLERIDNEFEVSEQKS